MKFNIINLFEVIFLMAIFYGFYLLFLRKETFFKLNRVYLLSSLIFSVSIPFLEFERNFFNVNSGAELVDRLNEIKLSYYQIREVVIVADGGQSIVERLTDYISILYFTGVLIAFLFFIVGFIRIILLVYKSTPKKYGRYRIIESNKILIPFSLFRWIIINPEKHTSDDMKQIIAHERMHAFQFHSIDLIIIEVLVILFWFNPFIYWYRKSIREVHEYLADQAVVENGYDRIDYQKLLLNQCIGHRYIGLTSRFSYSLSKNRLKMLTMMKSKSISKIKIALVIPVVLVALFLFIKPVELVRANDFSKSTPDLVSKQDTVKKGNVTIIQDGEYTIKITEDDTYNEVDKMPTFNGQEADAFRTFIMQNLKYPEEAQKNKEEGRVFVAFVVNKNGYVQDVEVVRGVSASLDKEAVRVVKSSPKWEPGYENDQVVNVRYTFPITFKLK